MQGTRASPGHHSNRFRPVTASTGAPPSPAPCSFPPLWPLPPEPTPRTHTQNSLAGIHRVARGTFRDALVIVNDILVAARPPRVLARVVQVLAEAEVHAAPVLEVVVWGRAGLHAPAIQVEVAAGHALGGVAGLGAVAQALAVAAEALGSAAMRLTDGRADWREREDTAGQRLVPFLSARRATLD